MNFAVAILLVMLGIFLAAVGGTIFGAIAGAIVGIFFDGTMHLLAQALGVPEAAPYQLGGMLGFVGGFFRSSIDVQKD